MTPAVPLFWLLATFLGGESHPAPPIMEDDLEQCVRTFRRAAAKRSNPNSQSEAQAALDALVALGDPEACEVIGLEFAQCVQHLGEVESEQRRVRAQLAQGQRVVDGLTLRAVKDESLAEVLKDQVRAAEGLARRLAELEEKSAALRPWKSAVAGGAGRLLTQLSDSRKRSALKEIWKQAEREEFWSTRLAAIGFLGEVGGEDTTKRLQAVLADLASECVRLERGLPRKEAEVRKMEARLQKESDQSGGGLSGASRAQYEKIKREAAADRRQITQMGQVCDECALSAGRALSRMQPDTQAKTLAALLKAQSRAPTGARLRTLQILSAVECEPAQAALLGFLDGEDEPLAIATILRELAPYGLEALPTEVAIAHLAHKSWLVQRAAIEALVVLGQREGVGAMIAALEGANGRLRTDLRGGLAALTGLDYHTNHTLWQTWWEAEGTQFEMPKTGRTLSAALPAEDSIGMSFFGISTESQRVLFLLDLSGSMEFSMIARDNPTDAPGAPKDLPRGKEQSRIQAAKVDLVRALGGLREGALFNLVLYASDVWTWQDELVVMEGNQRVEVQEYVDELSASGGTNIYGALRTALEIAGVKGGEEWDSPRIDTLFLLTDGRPSMGLTTNTDEILAYVRDKNRSAGIVIHTIGLSGAQDAYLLSELAAQNGGTYAAR
ncbi:MAG: VWA domain-containing protein [bacterium]